jgi:hypothetical protein
MAALQSLDCFRLPAFDEVSQDLANRLVFVYRTG